MEAKGEEGSLPEFEIEGGSFPGIWEEKVAELVLKEGGSADIEGR